MIDAKIISLAANTQNYGFKKKGTYTASCKNIICGDKIKIQIHARNGIVKNLRYETESCIFCQASANILSKIINSINVNELKNEIEFFYKSFKKDKLVLNKKYNLFKPLIKKKYKNRMNCILLPFNAILKALKI